MRTIIIPDLVRVGFSGDPTSQLELVIHDRNGRAFALQLDMEACRALREALIDVERQLLGTQALPTLPNGGEPAT